MADDVRERVWREPCKDRDSDAMCDVITLCNSDAWLKNV